MRCSRRSRRWARPERFERLGQVRIGLVFQRTEHHRLTGFGGDHDEHRFVTDELFRHQVFEHLLAVFLAVAEMEILQDEIVGFLRAHLQRLLTRVGSIDILDAQFTQHRTHGTAEIRKIIDDQKAFFGDTTTSTISRQMKRGQFQARR